ncbi:MAG: hypothetical protein C0184_15600, partial [Chloroflexus aggregans]
MSNVAKLIFPNGTLTADVPNKTMTFVSVPDTYYGTAIKGTRNATAGGSTLLIPKLDHVHAALIEYGYPPTTPTDEVATVEHAGNLGMGYDSMRGKFQVYVKKTFLGGIYGLDLKYAEMVTPLIGYGAKSTGGGARVFKTVDGGVNWTQLSYPTGSNDAGALKMVNTLVGFHANSSTGSIYKTTDGFATAPTLVYTGPSKMPSRFFFLDASHGWLVGANGYAVKTDDGGTSWALPGSPPAQSFNDVWMIDANTVIVAADHYVYLVTYSGSVWTWTDKTPTANAHYRRIQMYSSTVGYMVGNNGSSYARVWKTTNGGTSWTATYTSSSTIYDYRDLVVFNDTELIMAGANNASHGVVYKSTASGASPTMLNFDTPTGVTNLGIA